MGVGQRLRPFCARRRFLARYWAMPGEPNPEMLLATLADDGGRQCAPFVSGRLGGRMGFRACPPRRRMKWQKNRFRFVEGCGGRLVAPAAIAVVLVPLLAFDRHGGRLGRGKGHYDRTFDARWCRPLLVGVAWPEDEVREVPMEAHDQRLDAVITSEGLWPVSARARRRCFQPAASAKTAGRRDWRFLPGSDSRYAPDLFPGRRGILRPNQSLRTRVRKRSRGFGSEKG